MTIYEITGIDITLLIRRAIFVAKLRILRILTKIFGIGVLVMFWVVN